MRSFATGEQTLALPEAVRHWSLTTPRDKLIKIGAKVVVHGCYPTFQIAEVAVPRALFADILRLIARLRPSALPPSPREYRNERGPSPPEMPPN